MPTPPLATLQATEARSSSKPRVTTTTIFCFSDIFGHSFDPVLLLSGKTQEGPFQVPGREGPGAEWGRV